MLVNEDGDRLVGRPTEREDGGTRKYTCMYLGSSKKKNVEMFETPPNLEQMPFVFV